MNSEEICKTQKDKRKTKQVTSSTHPDRRGIETKKQFTILSDTNKENEDNGSSNIDQTATIVYPLAKPTGKSLKKRPASR